MGYNPKIHHRRSIRLKGYDYSRSGAYFITICCEKHQCRFGKIVVSTVSSTVGATLAVAPFVAGEAARASPTANVSYMQLNEFGQIAYDEWIKLSERFTNFELDVFQIMPNHMHGIMVLNDVQPSGQSHLQGQPQGIAPPAVAPTIGDIVGAYKSLVANRCLDIYKSKNEIMGKLWQRNYYEIIIRNSLAYENISNYIIKNPEKWNGDKFYSK